MQLAADTIEIEIAGEAYELRPTLRAATRLARRYGDFAILYQQILADHVSSHLDVIREGSDSPQAAADFLTAATLPALRSTLAPLKLPLLRFVLQLAGHLDDQERAPAAASKPIPFADYHAELFSIGTGWLGWSPAETWDATPAEILAAQRGRTALISDVLKAVFGAPADEPAPAAPEPMVLNDNGLDHTFDRAGLRALKGKGRVA